MSAGTLRAVVYCRASLDKTGQAASVERQEKACRALIDAREYELVTVLTDNSVSATSGVERPAWRKVLGMVERGEIDVVVAWHLDRVTRTMRDLEHLITLAVDKGVGVATATGDIDLTTDTGRMVARILAAVAAAEVERKAERQKLANVQRAAAGLPYTAGRRVTGYSADGLSIVEDEAEAIRWAAQAFLDDLPVANIAVELTARGIMTGWGRRSGREREGYSRSGVASMLGNPRYAGINVRKGEVMGVGAWPAILDVETHEAIVRKFAEPARAAMTGRKGSNRYKATTLLGQIVRCAVCDADDESAAPATTSSDRGRPSYACRRAHVHAWRAELDKAVTERVLGLISSPGFIASLTPKSDGRANKARKTTDQLNKRLTMLNDAMSNGVYDDNPEEYSRALGEIGAKLKAARAVLDEAVDTAAFTGLDIGTEAVIGQWADLPLARQRAIVERLFTVAIMPTGERGRAARPWSPERNAQIERRGEAATAG